MLEISRKIFSIFFAVVMLFSTLSFTVQKHICMGEITDVSFFKEADSCGMMVEKCDVDDLPVSKLKEKECCSSVQELIPGNDNEQQALNEFKIDQVQFALAYVYTYQNLFEQKNNAIPFNKYAPPLVSKDINVLYQTFLI